MAAVLTNLLALIGAILALYLLAYAARVHSQHRAMRVNAPDRSVNRGPSGRTWVEQYAYLRGVTTHDTRKR